MKICALTKSRITDYVTGTLTKGELREIESHLATCDDCRSLFSEITNVVDQIERGGNKRQRPPTRRDQTHNSRMHPVLMLNSTRQLVLILFTVFVLGSIILFIVPWDDIVVPGEIKSYDELQKPGSVPVPVRPGPSPLPGVAVNAPLVEAEQPTPASAVVNANPVRQDLVSDRPDNTEAGMSVPPRQDYTNQSYAPSTTVVAAMPFAPGPYQLQGATSTVPTAIPSPAGSSFLTPIPPPVPTPTPPRVQPPTPPDPALPLRIPQPALSLQPQNDIPAIGPSRAVPAPYAVPIAAPAIKTVATPPPQPPPIAPSPVRAETSKSSIMKVDAHTLVNAYDFDYKSPITGVFSLFHEFAPSPFKPGKVLMRVGLQSGRATGAARSRNRDLTLVLPPASDVPGTARMQLVLPLLLDSLGQDDSVSVMQCGHRAYTALSRVKATQKARIMAALEAESATSADWAGTLGEAMRLAEPRRGERIVVVVVNSDALDTPSGPNTWPEPIEGISVHVICVGRNPDRDVLATRIMRLYGGRRVNLATSSINWVGAFSTLLESASPAIARNVVIQNDFNRNIVTDIRPFRNASQVIANTDILPQLNSIHNGESVTMVYELTFARQPVAGERVGELTVLYEDPTTGAPRTAKRTCNGLDGKPAFHEGSRSFQLAGLFAHSARLMPPESTLNEADVSAVFRKLKALPRGAKLSDFVEAMELLNKRSNR